MCTDREKEVADFFLEQDNQCQCTDADQFVENGTQKFHFQYLGDKQPEYDENQHAEEYVQWTRLFHDLVAIEQHQCDKEDVDKVFQSEF